MKNPTKESPAAPIVLARIFFILSAVLLLLSGSLQLFSAYQAQQNINTSRLQLIAQNASRTVSAFIQETFSVLETTNYLTNPITASIEEQKDILSSLLGIQPSFRQILLLDSRDQTLAQISRISKDLSEQFVFQIQEDLLTNLHQGNRFISQVYIDSQSGEPMITLAVPVKDAFGDFQGSLITEVNLKFMWELVENLNVGKAGSAYVVDSDGDLIAFSDTARVLKRENLINIEKVNNFVNSYSGEAAKVSTYQGINEKTVVGAYVPLDTPPWAVVVELPWTEAYQEVIREGVWSIVIILVLALLAGIMGTLIARRLAKPLIDLMNTANKIAQGEIDLQAPAIGFKEIRSMAVAFNTMNSHMRNTLENLEQTVAERTRVIETSAEVSRRLSTILDEQQLVMAVVDEIQRSFDYYHAHIYLYDDRRENLMMVGGTGDAGQAMLARGHYLPKGRGLVGRAAINNQAVLVSDTSVDESWLPNPLLPETKSELAVPIAVGQNVLGVLDVQQNTKNGLTEHDIDLLQTIANQVAVAVQNSRQFATAQTQADRETLINTINQRIQSAMDIESVLEIAVQELGAALHVRQATIQIGNPEHSKITSGNN